MGAEPFVRYAETLEKYQLELYQVEIMQLTISSARIPLRRLLFCASGWCDAKSTRRLQHDHQVS